MTGGRLDLLPFPLLIDRVFEPLRGRFARLYFPVALPLAGAGLIVAFGQMGWIRALGTIEQGAFDAGAATGLALFVGGGMLYLLLTTLAYTALGVGCLDLVYGRQLDMGRAWRVAIRPRVFFTVVLTSVAVVVSAALCFLPVLYVAPVLAFALPVMVEERLYLWSAVRRCGELAHWNPPGRLADAPWVRALVILFVGLLFNYSVTLVVQLPFAVAQQVLLLRRTVGGEVADDPALAAVSWIQIPGSILGALAGAAGWLYWTLGIALYYRELRRTREGADLAAAIDGLTHPPGSATEAPA